MFVYLNPGHDRELDSGAVNHDGTRECDKAYELGMMVKALLEEQGIDTRLEQNDDLYGICTDANDAAADIFISLHFNAFNEKATGTETLISSSPSSLILGHCLQSFVQQALGLNDRGLKERMDLIVINSTAMPAALIELCFIDNDHDLAQYETKKAQVAQAICTAILTYKMQSQL